MSLPAMIGAATATVAVLAGGYLAVTHHDPAKPVAGTVSSPTPAVVLVAPPAPPPPPSAVPATPPTPASAKKGVAVWSFTGGCPYGFVKGPWSGGVMGLAWVRSCSTARGVRSKWRSARPALAVIVARIVGRLRRR